MTTRTNGSAAWPTRTGIDPCSRDCLSCGPGKSARRDHRNPGSAGGDGRESCEPRLRSEEHTSELQSRLHLVCRLLLEKKKKHKHLLTTIDHCHTDQNQVGVQQSYS